MPWLERAEDSNGDLGPLEITWGSLAGEAGAAVSSGTPGLSCPAGMVVDGNLCKTPATETVPLTRVCAQEGYELVTDTGELGTSHSCQKTVPAYCTDGKVLHQGQCQTETTSETTEQRDADWTCSEGTLVSAFVDPGYTYSCRVTLDPPECPAAESYRTTPSNGCYRSESYHQTAGYVYSCPSGYTLANAGEGQYCEKSVSPYCPGSLTYRNGACYSTSSYYQTAGYVYSCPSGYTLANAGEGQYCEKSVSPYCPGSLTYRNGACYSTSSYYQTAGYVYSCPSDYTLTNAGEGEYCSKTETYRQRVCSFDPIAGQQCWYETRTRTVTTDATRSCPSGHSANGANCRADSPTTTYTLSSTSPITTATTSATRSCPSGHSANGANCRADSPTTTYTLSSTSPITTATTSATRSCPSGYTANGGLCRADTASTRWAAAGSTPATSRTDDAQRSCATDYAWNDTSGKCEKTTTTTTYSNPTAPLTTVVGDPPAVSCPDTYAPAGGGRCSRTTLGPPTATPTGAGCIEDLGTLGAGAVSRSGTLAAGCVSLRKGDAQSPYYARRFSLRVSAASTAAFAVSSAAADVFVYVLSGSGSNVTEVDSDDDSGVGTDAKVTDVALAAGTVYTIEVTTSTASVTGAFTLSGTIAAVEPPVVITDLADHTGYGLAGATVTASDEFAVEPAGAVCTATTVTVGVTPSVSAGTAADKRKVSLALAAPFSHEVTVSCDAAGRTAAQDTATLAGKAAIGSVTVASGTACTGTAAARYTCTVPQGGALSVTVTAQGAHDGLSLGWAGSGGASVGTPTQAPAATVPSVGYSRTSVATLSCTADGTVTVTITAGAVARTVAVGVDCAVAADPCDDPLGSLADGVTTRSGTIAADVSCISPQRRSGSTSTYYARRHAFSLDAAATVTIDLGSASSNASSLDTYLLLLGGHNAGTGTVEGRNDDRGGGIRDSRIADRRLAAGDYTIEATTFRSRRTGDYDLSVTVVFDPAVESVTVASRGACEPDAGAAPHGVDVALECEIVNGQTAAVAATAVANHATIGLAWAAAGSASVAAAATPAATAILGPDSVAAGDWQTTASADLSCTADGTVTLTATAGPAGSADSHITRLEVDCVDPVTITGLDGATESGTSAVTVSDTFTVSPATAGCTASPVGTITSPAGGAAGDRVLSAGLAAPAAATITVTCTNDGRADGVEDVVFTHAGAVTSLGVRAVEGGRCERESTTPPGVDVGYTCVTAPGRAFRVAADASATASGLAVAWSVSGSVTVSGEEPVTVTPSLGPDGSTTWHRASTAILACTGTGTGTVTATATLPDAASQTARVSVSCLDAVEIAGLQDTTRAGVGTSNVADSFDVTPATAMCLPTVGTVTTDTTGTPGNRILTVPLTAPDSEEVTVTCTAATRADAVQTVTFAAVKPCSDHLGTLQPGAVTRSGTITADSGCTSPQRWRDGGSSTSRYARRHTFTLTQRARVTIELGSAASNASRLDTYLLLLEGHSSDGTGTVLGRNDDVGSGHGTHRYNSRLSGVELAPGDYTIEATTYGTRRTGAYDLAVSVTTVNGISNKMHVVQGEATRFEFGYAPANAVLTVPADAQTRASATLAYGGGSGTLTITGTATGTYAVRLDVAVPRTAAATSGANGARAAAPTVATHAAAGHAAKGTVCPAGNTVVIGGSSVCASGAGPSLTIRKSSTVTIPQSCITSVPLGRWYLTTQAWPTDTACVVPVGGTDRRARYYAFEVRELTAEVTIRLSSGDQDTHLALYANDPVVDGLNAVDVSGDVRASNDNAYDPATMTGYLYLDGKATDSRIHATPSRGVYAIVVTLAAGATPGVGDQYTLNIKVPYPRPGS